MALSQNLSDKIKRERRKAEEDDARRRAEKIGLKYLDLISIRVPTEIKAMALIEEKEARATLLVPIQLVGKKLVLAAFDPSLPKTRALIDSLKKKYEVEVVVASRTGLEHLFDYYRFIPAEPKEISGEVAVSEEKLKKFQATIENIPGLGRAIAEFQGLYTSELLEIILAGALALQASDIHLEPTERNGILRIRIDGLLHTVAETLSLPKYQSIVTRLKLLSNLKLNLEREPQDGRFTINLKDRAIEIRTSIIPSEYGETAVLRLLDPKNLKINLEELGFRRDDLEIAEQEIVKPNGLVLVTGPTGSGKTTTLYAFLRKVTTPEIKIITIEDPIEYHISQISQTQVDPGAGYTFASGLRSILRQDPDIILVGEIRDKETAEIAMNASLTGHLVFSTLHTNDAVGTIPRLIDLEVKPQIIGPALSLVIAQRLVRTLCTECKKEITLDEKTRAEIEKFLGGLPARIDQKAYKNFKIFKPAHCEKCGNLGYRGRTSIFELFAVNDKIEEEIYKNPTEIELKGLAKQAGLVTMQEDGLLKVLQGLTSIEEVERITGPIPKRELWATYG